VQNTSKPADSAATRQIPEETPAIARGHGIQKSPESRLKVSLWLNSAEKETVTK
jgi:hypothetical protein